MKATTTDLPDNFQLTGNETLIVMIFLAIIVHTVIILGVSFSPPEQFKINKAIDIVIATTPQKKTPKQAKYLAQENQQGAGNEQKKPMPATQKIPSQGVTQKKKHRKSSTKSQRVKKIKTTPKVVTQKKAVKKIVAKETTIAPKTPRPLLTAESLAQQIAQLGTKIRHQPRSSELSRIKFVDAVSTHKYLSANYERQWQEKVEKIGNLNYPEMARKAGITGKLTMDVGIQANGRIYSMRIRTSSGHSALDDAAKRIVRLGEPYAPLPKELTQELDVLVITRIWKFFDEANH